MSGVKNHLCRSRLFEKEFGASRSSTKMELRNGHYDRKRLIDYFLSCPLSGPVGRGRDACTTRYGRLGIATTVIEVLRYLPLALSPFTRLSLDLLISLDLLN
jgi:hypothetical protein